MNPSLRITMANRFLTRLIGWMGRRHIAPDEALLLRPCAAVHGLFMRTAIDVVFLDRHARVLRMQTLRPWGWAACRGAAMTLELAPGAVSRLGSSGIEAALARALTSTPPPGARAPFPPPSRAPPACQRIRDG